MQKFTVFTIILSLSILMILGDLVFHDYLQNNVAGTPQPEQGPQVAQLVEPDVKEVIVPSELPSDNQDEFLVEPSSSPMLSEEDLDFLLSAGFETPTLKEAVFSGLIFDFLPFNDALEADLNAWNFFNGENFVGTFVEMDYDSSTGAFQGYLKLRDDAKLQAELGTVNEVNNHGDASFYFNHTLKSKTVHMVIRKGNRVYAFQYSYDAHEKMKKLFDLI